MSTVSVETIEWTERGSKLFFREREKYKEIEREREGKTEGKREEGIEKRLYNEM